MACSRFEYVRNFESYTTLLPQTFIVVRLDGKGFTKFTDLHQFAKPNDLNGLRVMNAAAMAVCETFSDVFLAYGQSDEYSFVLRRDSQLYERREIKIVSTFVSVFTAHYVANFESVTGRKLSQLPSFDGRAVCYPSLAILQDYFAWRQADCHINNLYNTCFWACVLKGGKTRTEAEAFLKGTLSDFKNEMLFTDFGINYSAIEAVFRKGTLIVRREVVDPAKEAKRKELLAKDPTLRVSEVKKKVRLVECNDDLIQKSFWEATFPWLYEEEKNLGVTRGC